MENDQKVRLTVPTIIKAINEADDIITITGCENLLVCIYAVSFMFVGSIINFVVRYVVWHDNLERTLIDSIIFIILGTLFSIILKIRLKFQTQTFFVSALYSVWLIFLTVRFYDHVGPAIWTVAAIQVILAISRITKVMLTFIALTTFFCGIYSWVTTLGSPYQMYYVYYVAQTILFIVLFIVSSSVHKINSSRYKKINTQYKLALKNKEEITSLFEEIAASEEELRCQNDQLLQYNAEIVQNKEKLNHLAYFDTLTELPNRKMVIERINYLISTSNEQSIVFYVVFVDIDNFKFINDTMGHYVGDLLIQAAASRLKKFIDVKDLIGQTE